ncbi:MAG: hypothetical protein M1830_010589 [Pleopsidium flavum]|nr:MAG: hypothetical protein M1830_010589 [Pleopsidium flavum]
MADSTEQPSPSIVSSSSESAFTFLPQGALIQEFIVNGINIVQGFPTADLYVRRNTPYFGETIGRTTNRIKGGIISNLNGGKEYRLPINNGPNSLHGGGKGWGKALFDGPKALSRNGKEGVEFRYLSKDGEEGYPGTVECRVWYTAGKEGERTVLDVEYEVELVGDAVEETVVGVTNHSYFNLSNNPTIEGTIVTLGTNAYLPLDSTGIPHGPISPYPTLTPNTPFTLGHSTPDLDDCFIMNSSPASIPLDTRPLPLKTLATLHHPSTGLHLEIQSTEPAFQFYTGKYIDVPEIDMGDGKKLPARGPRSGICVEPSRYVNCAGREEWRGMCLLRKGEVWGARSVYRAWKA